MCVCVFACVCACLCVCVDNGPVILSLSFLRSRRCRVMKDSCLLQRDGFSYKTAESEEKRARDEKRRGAAGRQVW